MVVWHRIRVGHGEGQPLRGTCVQTHRWGKQRGTNGKTGTAGISALLPGSPACVTLGKLCLFLDQQNPIITEEPQEGGIRI